MPAAPAQPDVRTPRRRDWASWLEAYGSFIALAILVLLGCLASEDFRKAQNFLNVLRQSSFVGIIAVGMTFVIILGGIDLSVGSMVALLGAMGILTSNALSAHLPAWAAVSAGAGVMLVGGALLGLFNGMLIAKGRLAPFIATLGAMAAYRSIALATAQGGQVTVKATGFGHVGAEGIPVPFIHVAENQPLTLDYPVLIFAVVAVLAHLLLKKTRFGLNVHAIGANERAAQYAAVHVDRVRIGTYTLMGAICGVSAFLVASRHESISTAQTGLMYELDAIAAVVVGGASMAGGSGRVLATVAGVLILGFVNNLMSMVITPWLQRLLETRFQFQGALDVNHLEGLIKGAIIIAAVLVQRGRKSS